MKCCVGLFREDPAAQLLRAAGEGDVVVLTSLLDAGVSPAACDGDGFQPLHRAAMGGHDEVIRVLLAAGATADAAQPSSGWTPLHLAAWKGHAETVKALLAGGARHCTTDSLGCTAAHMAAHEGNAAALRALLAAGADPEAAAADGDRPLHKVVRGWRNRRWLECANVLITVKADPTAPNKQGETPLSAALGTGNGPLYQVLSAAAKAQEARLAWEARAKAEAQALDSFRKAKPGTLEVAGKLPPHHVDASRHSSSGSSAQPATPPQGTEMLGGSSS